MNNFSVILLLNVNRLKNVKKIPETYVPGSLVSICELIEKLTDGLEFLVL